MLPTKQQAAAGLERRSAPHTTTPAGEPANGDARAITPSGPRASDPGGYGTLEPIGNDV